MSVEQRRDEIVRAALPLLVEHGATLTTRAVAQAAGVAEGTVFRVFADKEELLRACVSEAFRTDEACARIRGIPAEYDVEERLKRAASVLLDYFRRLGRLVHSLSGSGYDVHRHEEVGHDHADHEPEFVRQLLAACVTLTEPDRQCFRVPTETLIRMLFGLVMSMRFDPTAQEDEHTALALRVDVLLRGALAERGPERHR
ncbi:TetR/AcrR family transcriptional regulator [Actinopolyspora mortivallis]|uniref:TetR/AcrR family transcriptional regulator n=1 Tax=Actinopolyspora mortivallis TaxID=33906 RepID=A0A2T0GYL4_ACTMO|nr:TetR/AcrR family transcriptional regulator [Actinopolyspora mortivallis]PRW64194.1 TetR/AcrR family transcriptional regulator [Actinopolyspora mortivallis]